MLVVGVFAGPLLAQPGAPDESPAPDAAIRQYLSDRNLDELLAAHLLDRLRTAEGEARTRLADRLGSLYVKLLDKARTAPERQQWEARSQELLKTVPEAESFDLRLNLAKARYLQAEEVAERHRLRLATPEERQESERVMRTVGASFQDMGAKVSRRVETLEKKESTGREEDEPRIRDELAENRRLRSLAMYYAGWASYYAAFLSAKPPTDETLNQFGWLLNASGGRPANVERLPASLLRYEHVARAAIGCALAESLRGRDGAALLWLDAIESAEGVPDAVRKQVFPRRLVVLSQAKRWADIDYLLKKRRDPGKDKPAKPLDVADARLLAVLTLEALQDKSATPIARELIQALADTAMTDLVTLGEVKHVQDLVGKYGSAPLGGNGFIVQYVRGMQAYDRAREAHTATGKNTEEPTALDSVQNLYHEAAASLEIATKQPDAARFPDQRSNAALVLGLSLFYAGDLQQAADRFEQAFESAGGAAKQSEDALWLAIVSLDKAVEAGKPSLRERLSRLGTLYLKTYPKSERAAKLLLRQAGGDMISEDKAVEILLGVDKNSPLFEAARRQAASILYAMYRKSRGTDRDFAANRFAEVSDEILRLDSRKLTEGTDADKQEAAAQIIIRARQLLDAVLGMTAPDLERAEKAFQLLDSLAADRGLDLKKVDDELTFRRLQVALARSRTDEANRLIDRLHALGGRFSDAADRVLYKRALTQLASPSAPTEAAAEVVRHGRRVMEQFGRDAVALKDPAVYALHNAVADAAARVWRANRDQYMRDIALETDRNLTKVGNAPIAVLRRYAEISESTGDRQAALDCWRLLLSGTNPTAPDWYEARYHSLRLLLALDPARAREAMDQYKVLHPDFGPEPWGGKLRELADRMPIAPLPAPLGSTGANEPTGHPGSTGGGLP